MHRLKPRPPTMPDWPRKLLTRISRFRISGKLFQTVAEAGGFGVGIFAAWEVERLAGLVLLSGVLLLYGNRRPN